MSNMVNLKLIDNLISIRFHCCQDSVSSSKLEAPLKIMYTEINIYGLTLLEYISQRGHRSQRRQL